MILLTAANGRTGRAVLAALVRRGRRVRAVDIDPAVEKLEQLGASSALRVDLRNPGEVEAALQGVDTVVHIGPPMHPQEAEIGRHVVSAARREGVSHLVLFSVVHPQLEPLLNHQAKLAVERSLLTSRVPFTILQPMHYFQNLDVSRIVASGRLQVPYDLDTPLSHVDLEDVAEVAAGVAGEVSHRFATYELCGDSSSTARQLAASIGTAARVEVLAEQVPFAPAFRGPGRAAGGDEAGADAGGGAAPPEPGGETSEEEDYRRDALVRLFDHYSRYGITGNSNVLRWLLGRAPRSLEQYLAASLPPAR